MSAVKRCHSKPWMAVQSYSVKRDQLPMISSESSVP